MSSTSRSRAPSLSSGAIRRRRVSPSGVRSNKRVPAAPAKVRPPARPVPGLIGSTRRATPDGVSSSRLKCARSNSIASSGTSQRRVRRTSARQCRRRWPRSAARLSERALPAAAEAPSVFAPGRRVPSWLARPWLHATSFPTSRLTGWSAMDAAPARVPLPPAGRQRSHHGCPRSLAKFSLTAGLCAPYMPLPRRHRAAVGWVVGHEEEDSSTWPFADMPRRLRRRRVHPGLHRRCSCPFVCRSIRGLV